MKTDIKKLRLEYKSQPFKIGDEVVISHPYEVTTPIYTRKKQTGEKIETVVWQANGVIVAINGDVITVTVRNSTQIPLRLKACDRTIDLPITSVEHDVSNVGHNPIKRSNHNYDFMSQTIFSLVNYTSYIADRETGVLSEVQTPKYGEKIFGMNFDPYIIDGNGVKVHYQRELVWSAEQKQLLIESIYEGVDINKFLFRRRAWPNIENQLAEDGVAYSVDCVDGKQRMDAIVSFMQDKFPDQSGYYWSDLSSLAKRHFQNRSVSVGILNETATDADVREVFLMLNHAGVPMSKEHLDFVKSINVR